MYPKWHIPLYAFGWAFGIVNPIIYVAFNQSYRAAFTEAIESIKNRLTCGRATAAAQQS
jgi:hypothetical protein